MKVLVRPLDGELHRHLREERARAGGLEVGGGVEAEPVAPRARRRAELGDAAVVAGAAAADLGPVGSPLERDRHARRGAAACRVEHVGRDGAHRSPRGRAAEAPRSCRPRRAPWRPRPRGRARAGPGPRRAATRPSARGRRR